MSKVKLGDRLVQPTKIVCVGRNYLEHIQELNNAIPDQMVVFSKPTTSISEKLHSFHQERLHYEGEICFLIENGELAAVGLGLDLTKRDLQSNLKAKGLPWERAKAFDGSAVFSRFIPLDGISIDDLEIELFINCVRVQKGSVRQMMYPPQVILEELNSYTTLCDGDIIMTGTPQGVGEVHPSDLFLARLKQCDDTLIEIEWVAE
ncbi:FAA hydrolase family protein [Vibrio aquaticus]|uniref:FAA hydrolase family protein n=1 Tax=Vibrio aquaticus TaxID=2496559 RepID=A0A432D2H7_9VIBR|nr:fumarylacetoacetate hydrolase family protein [Vibrio aquaticus]RTZ18038.1 FAA hydrolase family protein [Vibrio aquaticus]